MTLQALQYRTRSIQRQACREYIRTRVELRAREIRVETDAEIREAVRETLGRTAGTCGVGVNA